MVKKTPFVAAAIRTEIGEATVSRWLSDAGCTGAFNTDVEKVLKSAAATATELLIYELHDENPTELKRVADQLAKTANPPSLLLVGDNTLPNFPMALADLTTHVLALETAPDLAAGVINQLREIYAKRRAFEKRISSVTGTASSFFKDNEKVGYITVDPKAKTVKIDETCALVMTGVDAELSESLDDFAGRFNEEDRGKFSRFVDKCAAKGARVRPLTVGYFDDKRNAKLRLADAGKGKGRRRGFRIEARDITAQMEFDNRVATLYDELKGLMNAYNALSVETFESAMARSAIIEDMGREIGGPMNEVITAADHLLDSELDSDQRSYSTSIKRSAEALLTLANDLADLSRARLGSIEIESIDFDLRNTVDELVDFIQPSALDKEVDFSCLVHHEVPSLLRGDVGKLRQVLEKLAGNGVKFTESGDVDLRIHLEEENDKTVTLLFEVNDTGAGISADKSDSIFEPFTHFDDGAAGSSKSSLGLGLAIAKELVGLMGGEIWVKSIPGIGSNFSFTLTFEKQHLPRHEIPSTPDDVLVVDNNETNVRVLTEHLSSWGCRYAVASDPDEALEVLRAAKGVGEPYSIVVIADDLPGSGEELGRRIKAETAISDVQLAMVFSVGKRGDGAKLSSLGFSAYIPKPFKHSLLYRSLAALAGRQMTPPEERPGTLITRHSLMEDLKLGCNILVAEDNVISQKMTIQILGRFGFEADIAKNGCDAVELLKHGRYDVVLMAVQMPAMDGISATVAIRDPATGVSNPQVPIIGMTPHAMEGDRRRCLEAGMNDYVSKPIHPKELYEAVERCLEYGGRRAHGPGVEHAAAFEELIFDNKLFMEKTGEDEGFVRELLKEFIADGPGYADELHDAFCNGDCERIQSAAYSLKEASGTVTGGSLQAAALEVELAAKYGDLSRIEKLLPVLDEEVDLLFSAISDWLGTEYPADDG